MAIIEARSPDGKLIELTEVQVTESGMLVITDDEGQQIVVHRYAWEKLVNAVNVLLDGATQKASAKETKRKR